MTSDKCKKFYENAWFMWISLVFLPPLGIFLLWRFHPDFSKKKKIVLTVIFALWFIVCLCVPTNSYQNSYSNSKTESTQNETNAKSESNDNSEEDSKRKEEEEKQQQEVEENIKQQQEISNKINNLEGKTLTEAMTVLSELGKEYSVKGDSNSYDYTEECKSWSQEMTDGWIVKSIGNGWFSDVYTIKITTQEAVAADQMKETLQAKLSADNAETAVMLRGEQEYPYGFKFKYFTGETSDTVVDENTWLIKRSCEITNAFGAKATMTCEAKVTGTNSSPQVLDFTIY